MGKVKQILKNTTRIQYFYDAMGNRVMKMVHNNYTLNLPPETQEYYIRDASGNIMSTYKRANASAGTSYNMKVTANDQPMYGSDRLGSHISGYLKNNTNTSTIYNSSIYGYYILLPTISLPTANSLKSDRLVSYRMMDYKRYEIKDHLGNVRTTFGDYRLSLVTAGGGGTYTKTNFEADQKSMYNLYAFGMSRYGNDQYYEANDIPLSLTSAYTYRFGFNGQHKDDDIKGAGNSLNFGARIYDSRLGRWLSLDPLQKKFADLSPYNFVDNSPIRCKDADGEDIIILSAPKGAAGAGHAAVLIGNEKDGWKLYSKNGTFGLSGALGPSNKNPQSGIPFKTLKEFANSEANFNMENNAEVEYTSAFKITTDKATDAKMAKAASKTVGSYYNVLANSCIDVCSDALEAGGYDGGTETKTNPKTGEQYKTKTPLPNVRYSIIRKNNKGIDVTKNITPTEETKMKMKDNSVGGQKAQQEFEQRQGEQNFPAILKRNMGISFFYREYAKYIKRSLKMLSIIISLFALFFCCQTPSGFNGASKDILESKKRNVFICEYTISTNPYKINDSLQITVNEAWLERHWAYGKNENETLLYPTEQYQLCINTEENDIKGICLDWTIGVDFDKNLRMSSENSLMGDFKTMPTDTIEYKVQKGNELSENYKKNIIGIFVLVKKGDNVGGVQDLVF